MCVQMSGDDKSEEQLKAVYFAAGVAVFMACIERAVVVSVFMHWRVWVFLVLNLLLLAILFTSKPKKTSTKKVDQDDGTRMKTSQEGSPPVSTNVVEEMQERGDSVECEVKINSTPEDGIKKEDDDVLSKEELNRRAEAFIAKFRQHLVSDSKG